MSCVKGTRLLVRRNIKEATEEVRAIVKARRATLEVVARRLMEQEVIDRAELRALIESHDPGPRLVPGTLAVKGQPPAAEGPAAETAGRRAEGVER
jgi:hypothetical protein